MADRRSFLLRVDPALLEAMQRWADADLRSLNGQIEWVLRRALQDAGRVRAGDHDGGANDPRGGAAPRKAR